MKEITLWHGGRNLEYDYKKKKQSNKSRWEYGPGIYLTTHYETAKKYAKGGGNTYKVCFFEGKNTNDVFLNIEDVLCFVNKNVVKNKKERVLEDIHMNMKRFLNSEKINSEYFLNIIINNNALIGKNILNLNLFLVDSGIDYSIVKRFGGRDETVVVIFNNEKIKTVKKISSNDLDINEYELLFEDIKKIKNNI